MSIVPFLFAIRGAQPIEELFLRAPRVPTNGGFGRNITDSCHVAKLKAYSRYTQSETTHDMAAMTLQTTVGEHSPR